MFFVSKWKNGKLGGRDIEGRIIGILVRIIYRIICIIFNSYDFFI